ncbi:hypothetical protein CDIK_4008 [Cucumispora dikerogammari]|nr:hypothetical protein CDIK_4008 [Cucumispora dikerogammari]
MIFVESQHLNKKYVYIQLDLLSEPRNIFLVLCRIKTTVNLCVVKEMIYSVIIEYDLDINFMSLLISDAASYMLKAKSGIQKKHKNIFHITCFAHFLHNCALRIKNHFKNIDFLISSVKIALIKSIARKEKFVNISLSPQPIITRWGSRLEAFEYYYKYLSNVGEIIKTFEKDDKIIDNVSDAFKNTSLSKDLIYIHKNYKFILDLINATQEEHFSNSEAIEMFVLIDIKENTVDNFLILKSALSRIDFLELKILKI